jgi:hypothetical protein
VWRLLAEQPFGRILEQIAGGESALVMKLYLHDYLHMLYKPATQHPEEFQVSTQQLSTIQLIDIVVWRLFCLRATSLRA